MARILTTLHLSDIQKEVLAKVKAAPNPQIAWEEISDAASNVDQNLAAARDVLGNLGLLMVGDGVLEVTEKGEDVMKDSNLLDDMGELTDDAQQFISKREPQPAQPPVGDEDLGIPMESLTLIRDLNERAEELMKLNEMMNTPKLDIRNVDNLEVDGVDTRDYPDFVDAYFSYGVWKDTGRELTDEELDALTDQYSDVVNQMAHESLH